jgi:peptidoglycan/LPS O-acetylase OafA/YrhL
VHFIASPWPSLTHRWTAITFSDKLVILATNFTLTRAYFNDLKFIGVAPAWMLTVEETFYLTAPLILLTIGRRMTPLLAWCTGLLSVGVAMVLLHGYVNRYGFMDPVPFMLGFTFFGRCSEFLIGVGLAQWLYRQPVRARSGGWLTGLGGAAILGYLVLSMYLPASSSQGLDVPVYYLLRQVAFPLGIAVFFACLIRERSSFRHLLETRAFDLLGRASNVFYLIHGSLLNTLFEQHVSAAIAVRLVFMTGVSIALYKFIEDPLHKLLKARTATTHKE